MTKRLNLFTTKEPQRATPVAAPVEVSQNHFDIWSAINVSNFGGGHCQTYRQHHLWGPSSMFFPSSVVAATENTNSTPRGPVIDVSNFGGGRYRKYPQHPQGARHLVVKSHWWCMDLMACALVWCGSEEKMNNRMDLD
jgi:hypothetical protein